MEKAITSGRAEFFRTTTIGTVRGRTPGKTQQLLDEAGAFGDAGKIRFRQKQKAGIPARLADGK